MIAIEHIESQVSNDSGRVSSRFQKRGIGVASTPYVSSALKQAEALGRVFKIANFTAGVRPSPGAATAKLRNRHQSSETAGCKFIAVAGDGHTPHFENTPLSLSKSFLALNEFFFRCAQYV